MLSWYGISIAFGFIVIPFTSLVIAYLVWNSKQLFTQIDNKWKNVRISSQGSNEHRLRAVRVPGERNVRQLQLGGTVSSTSSVHPTKETWLNIQNSSDLPSNDATARPTMRDLQDMFAPAPVPQGDGASSSTTVAQEAFVTSISLEQPTDSAV